MSVLRVPKKKPMVQSMKGALRVTKAITRAKSR
jgi:hypothetical protein